ncbi:MAG: 1,4-alpha-glucan branching protein GlgB [Rhodanobacteraceae bacterium]|nr:MAG: 1,4-alpha-glucan branching protein GlgB [Rhodanobacteraceae bacterium]
MPSPASRRGSASRADAAERLHRGEHAHPCGVLDIQAVDDPRRVAVRCFLPGALRVEVVERGSGRLLGALSPLGGGCFAGTVAAAEGCFAYRLRVHDAQGVRELDDPYAFPPLLGDLDCHLLAEGNHWRAYEVLGAHARRIDGVDGVAFAVWAPNAERVSVVGSFNRWDGRAHVMRWRFECGVWELFVPGVGAGELYKYEVRTRGGSIMLKSDPYAFATELPPGTASRTGDAAPFAWNDQAWMAWRASAVPRNAPLAIYEVHLGSWRRHADGSPLGYDELADALIPYVRGLGFTHLELLPVNEHPFGGSWGYQPTALFAPSARWGSPEGLRRFIDRCHAAGLGVLLDWVPAHFPRDAHGLERFDGSCLYEHEDPRLGYHPAWGTAAYNYGRREVANFLIANALYWLREFHVDGLRVDAVASMLYLDYARAPGQWLPNRYGGHENLEAVAFLRRFNEIVHTEAPAGVITVAEESTTWPMVTRPAYVGGLGFDFKWNMGWMNDTLAYMRRDPVHRRYHHDQLTFGLLYAFSENFVLPLSHDEVVHGKGSLLGKMPGDRWQRLANLRLYLAFQYAQPGKKLLFMGGELAQEREWNHDGELDWHLLADPDHRGVQHLVRDLNHLYRTLTSLHRSDCEADGFQWIDCSDSAQSVLVWRRMGGDSRESVVVACNFTPVPRLGYRIGVSRPGHYREVLNSDARDYGGSGMGNGGSVSADEVPWHDMPCSLALTLPPLATLILLAPAV